MDYRKLCLIKKDEKGYTRSVLIRFIRKVGEDNLNKIIEEKVIKLLKSNTPRDFDAVLDAYFIKGGAHATQPTAKKVTLTLKQGLDEQAECSL